jgi:hypothetical protein
MCCSGVEDLAARKSDWTFCPQIVGILENRNSASGAIRKSEMWPATAGSEPPLALL